MRSKKWNDKIMKSSRKYLLFFILEKYGMDKNTHNGKNRKGGKK